MSVVRHLVVGPAEHGVTVHATRIVQRLRHEMISSTTPPSPNDLPTGGLLHLHVTDRLFGSSPEEAADVVLALTSGRACSVTLHDLPQPSDGAVNHPRRATAYARIAAACRGVVVASGHEEGLLRAACAQAGVEVPPVAVVPLPVDVQEPRPDVAQAARAATTIPRDVAVLGFLYPGKGHEAALEALDGLPSDVGLLAIGRPSPGHDDLAGALRRRGAEQARRVDVTGYVADADLVARLRAVSVPAAPHEHVSASGSIGSWLSAGRRPLVPTSPYARELEEVSPGVLVLYGPDAPAGSPRSLGQAVTAALQDPLLTWLPPETIVRPTTAQAARAYDRALTGWAGGAG